jgi:hypothetical protein
MVTERSVKLTGGDRLLLKCEFLDQIIKSSLEEFLTAPALPHATTQGFAIP